MNSNDNAWCRKWQKECYETAALKSKGSGKVRRTYKRAAKAAMARMTYRDEGVRV